MALSEYRDWLAGHPPRAEIMHGAHGRPIARGDLKAAEAQAGDPLTAGGYGETRNDYTSSLFAPTDGSEPRTVHIGLDIFAAAGTPVFAPFGGRVHSFADNAGEGDYGPTIILEHQPLPGLVFHTLYGHLSRASLKSLDVGKLFDAGDQIGRLGSRAENGRWTPHLHVQVMLEIGEARGDYPGACRASEREHWLAACPDPAELLGLQLA